MSRTCNGSILTLLCLTLMSLAGASRAFGVTLDDARRAFDAGDYDQARIQAQALTLSEPKAPAPLHLLAQTLTATGDYSGALRTYRQLSDNTGGENLQAEVALARLERLLGQAGTARDRMEKMLAQLDTRLETASRTDLIAAGDAYRHLAVQDPALFHRALEYYEKAIERDPQEIQAHVAMGDLLLDRYNNTEALEAYRAALALQEDHLPALFGLARSQRFDYSPQAEDTLRRCLQLKPSFVAARVLLARLLIDSENYQQAEQQVREALAVNPRSPEALTALAAIHYLRNQHQAFDETVNEVRRIAPGFTELFQTLAEVAGQNRRYRNAAEFAVVAVNLDPSSWRGHLLAGQNRLRLGEMARGRQSLETAFSGDPYEVRTKNTLDLLDRLETFEIHRSERFILVAEPGEASVLAPRLLPIAEQAYDFFSARYAHQPATPIRIEVYSRHEDFSVRTVGLVGLDIVGVSFGPVIALDSPSSGAFGPFNWASALWHEIAHSFHLSLTRSRVPRWFTEGLAVYEERLARPGWGDDVTPGFLQAFRRRKLPGIANLNRVFLRPSYPDQIPHAYFQGSLMMEMIEQQHGFGAITAMLQGYAENKSTAAMLNQLLGSEEHDFDARFGAYVKERYRGSLAGLFPPDAADKATDGDFSSLMKRARSALEAGALDQAIDLGERAQALFPAYGGAGSAYDLLARIHEERGELQAAIERREASIAIDADDLAGHRELARLYSEAGKPDKAAATLERAVLIQPFDGAMHQRLAEIYETQENWPGAAAARAAVVALDPVDETGARFELARALNRVGDPAAARRQLLRTLEQAPLYEEALDLLLAVREQIQDRAMAIDRMPSQAADAQDSPNPNPRTTGGQQQATE